jgi:hypothetical protein
MMKKLEFQTKLAQILHFISSSLKIYYEKITYLPYNETLIFVKFIKIYDSHFAFIIQNESFDYKNLAI